MIDELALAIVTIKRVREDVNWMLNNEKLLNPDSFAYLHDAADKLRVDERVAGAIRPESPATVPS